MTDPTPAPQTAEQFLDALFEPWNRSDQPGLVVGVAQNGQVLYRRGFGLACLRSGVANGPTTKMRLASTSKHFTCVLALLLAEEEGKLDIDSGIRTYIPELHEEAGNPSLRQLMNHSGGIRDYLDISMMTNGVAQIPPDAALEYHIAQRDVNFPVGERLIYCNGGYHLLSQVIKRVTGQSFEAALEERILRPMGMIDTASVPNDLIIVPGMATLHAPLPTGGWRQGIGPWEANLGDGAMVTTIDDMFRWMAHLRAPTRLGSPALWEQLTTPARGPDGSVLGYCLGIMRQDYRGVEVLHHSGGAFGGSAQMITVPAHGLDIMIMTNGAALDPTAMSFKIIDHLLAEHLGAPIEAVKAEAERRLIGPYYAPTSGLICEIADRNGELTLDGGPARRRPDGGLVNAGWLLSGTVIRPADDHDPAMAINIDHFGMVERADRLPEVPPSVADAAEGLVGAYRIPEALASAMITLDGDRLTMMVQGRYGRQKVSLAPVAQNVLRASLSSPPFPNAATLSLARGPDGAVRSFRISTGRTRNLRAEREPG